MRTLTTALYRGESFHNQHIDGIAHWNKKINTFIENKEDLIGVGFNVTSAANKDLFISGLCI